MGRFLFCLCMNYCSFVYEAFRRDGDFDMSTWSADPYDPDFKKGVLRNLSEDYHYDVNNTICTIV